MGKQLTIRTLPQPAAGSRESPSRPHQQQADREAFQAGIEHQQAAAEAVQAAIEQQHTAAAVGIEQQQAADEAFQAAIERQLDLDR